MAGLDPLGVNEAGTDTDTPVEMKPSNYSLEMTFALIEAAYDRNGDCKQIVCDSLFNLGKRKPELVLSSCHKYLQKHTKLPEGHRVAVLQSMERIINERLEVLDKKLAVDIITQASNELTESKDVVPEWQMAASDVLVALGKKYCNEVMDEMLKKFHPYVLPHFYIVQTIANLTSANVYAMVPHQAALLGTMLPMLGLAKHDNMRWVFVTAISKFSEAVIEYLANIDKAPYPFIEKEMFSSEIFSAYDVIFTDWIQSKDPKLRLAIVEALGHMTHLMAPHRLVEQLPKILTGILGLYKRHSEQFHVTQGLSNVLDTICKEGSTILEPYLEQVLNALFPQVFAPIDMNNPLSIKNHNEVLRCYQIIARSFSSKLTGVLLQKLDHSNEKTKIGILTIFKHLINAATTYMEDKREVILSGLKSTSQENSNKVKKAIAMVVMAMGHHSYLELEGGSQMIEFIVAQCALKDDPTGTRLPTDPEFVTNKELRQMCDHVLQLLTNTVEGLEHVLWPLLLELFIHENYTEASGIICDCLSTLANKNQGNNVKNFEFEYEMQVNLPKSTALMARLMTLAGRPLNGRNRGVHVLNLMKALAPILHENLVELWDTVIPKLIQYLEDPEKQDNWSQKSWEDLMCKMLSKSLDVVGHEQWIAEFGEAFGDQIKLFSKYPEEKNFLYKCIGIIMRKSTKKDFVNKMLDLIFSTVKHTDQMEREGCAMSFGYCATSHLDAVLTKLETVTKTDMSQKKSGILSFMKGDWKSDADVEKIKATVLLCYGFVALYSPPSLIISRMEATILRSLTQYFSNVKDASVKQDLIRAIDQIGQALHPSHLGRRYNFTNRGEFITHLQTYMSSESTHHLTSETRTLALNACCSLVKLDPVLSGAEIFELIKTATHCVFDLPADGSGTTKNRKGVVLDKLELEVLMEATFQSLENLLCEILRKDVTPAKFEAIYMHLVPWYLSLEDHERERAVKMTQTLLKFMLEHWDYNKTHTFSKEYVLLARLVPRCSDPSTTVRQCSMDCIQSTLQVAQRCEGFGVEYKDHMVDTLATLRERLQKGYANVLFSAMNELSEVISEKLPSNQLRHFVDLILEGLVDPQSHSSSGACVVLNAVMKDRGHELGKEVDHILQSIYDRLFQIQFPQTKTGALRSIRMLAQHHIISVLKSMFTFNLPYDENVKEIWKILSQDAQLTTVMLDHMLQVLEKSLPYEDKSMDSRKPIKMATQIPMAITSALVEIFQVEETEDQVLQCYPRLFAASMVRIGSSIGVETLKPHTLVPEKETKNKKKAHPTPAGKPVKPSSVAVDGFKKFLTLTKTEDVIDDLDKEDMWKKFEDPDEYIQAFNFLTKSIVNSSVVGSHISKIVACLTSVLSSPYDTQRIVVVTFLAELVNQKCMEDDCLLEVVMNSLLGRLVDPSHVVRQMCICGLGNIASIGQGQVQKYSTTVLSAMLAGMDDKDDPEDDITTEAMSGLSRILTEIDESHIHPILINVSLRIRPYFEKDKVNVRAEAIILFGKLAIFGDGSSKQPFLEQIHSSLVSLLLHLNDPQNEVKKASKYTLRKVGVLMGSDAVNTMFQKLLLDDANLYYGEFMNDLSKLIIKDFPEKLNFNVMVCVSFFKSMWPEIRSNAALFTGFLLGNLPAEKQGMISKEHVLPALIFLLKDPSATVRSAAAEAISLLDEY